MTDINKKRGRPKKSIIINDTTQKKGKSVNNVYHEIKNNEEEEEKQGPIILHLPITSSDTKKFGLTTSSEESPIEIIVPKKEVVKNKTIEIEDTDEKNDRIAYLEKEIEKYRQDISKLSAELIPKRKAYYANVNFVDTTNGNKITTQKTDIACWWCTYKFNTPPCYIPDTIIEDNYYVFGCFCSYNCAAAYNIKCMNDCRVWVRHGLIIKLISKIYPDKNKEINLTIAPDKEVLQRYGGHLTIDQYRNLFYNNNIECSILLPPMKSIVPIIEEINILAKKDVQQTSNNEKDQLVLKRSKPLPNAKNDILQSMK